MVSPRSPRRRAGCSSTVKRRYPLAFRPRMADEEEDPHRDAAGEKDPPSTNVADEWLWLGIGRPAAGGELRELPLFPHHPARGAEASTSGPPAFPPWGASGSIPGVPRAPRPPPQAAGRPDAAVAGAPSRPHVGLWFALVAAQHQAMEPYLPQLPKRYLRIKDGTMTVRLVIRYLAIKLGLVSESEVEITCRGQLLPPSATLQQVRDNIWCSRETTLLPSNSPAITAVMTLQYGRRSHTLTQFL